MMLTIHGLPLAVKYADVKSLIKEKCNINDYILDNLVSAGDGTKKVRIGLADEREGSYLIKCLEGFRMGTNVLSVVPVGKAPQANPPTNYDQRGGYPPRNDYANQTGPNYGNRPMDMGRPEPMMHQEPNRADPWASNSNNQWGPPQQSSNQGMAHSNVQPNNFGYQQPQPMNNAPYGQQPAPHIQRPEMRPYDQRDQFQARIPLQDQGYGFPPKNSVPDQNAARRPERGHVLRSVEIVDEPLNRPVTQRYPPPVQQQHKPITIMKDNFQGPQFNLDRQPGQVYQPPSGQGHPPTGHQGQAQQPWGQNIPQDKPPFAKTGPAFDRKYSDPKGPVPPKTMGEAPQNIHGYKEYEKPGPRFSPRRDLPGPRGRMQSPERRMSPGRRIPSPERRMGSPGRVIPPGQRMPSPGRRMPSPGRRMPSPGRRMASPGRRIPSPGRRMLSPGRRSPSPGRRMVSPGRRMASPGRRMASPGRRMASPGRRMPSPGRRMPSPGRRMPSPGRRLPSPGRRLPSPGRRMLSPGRRMPSPGRRMPSPGKRVSPGRRMSPERMGRPMRRDSPPRRGPSPPHKRHEPGRFSPPRHPLDKPGDKYDPSRPLKDVRPAYDGPSQAPNQAMYSGGYRPGIHDNIQYPTPGVRPDQRSPWQQEREKGIFPGAKKDDDIRRMPKFEPRDYEGEPKRKSRSPIRRDRSPIRDRFKKHSPSPRSPRRSWALEKRSSPEVCEAPPPPIWPGQSREDNSFRSRFDREEDKKRMPVWEPRRIDDDRRFEEPRPRPDIARPLPEPPHFKLDDRFPPRDPKFAPREPKFEPREEFPRTDDKRFDRDDDRHGRIDKRREDFRDDFEREDRKFPKIPDVDKEFEDIYKRAVEFSKRAEELRKRSQSADRRRDEFEGRRDDRDVKFDRKFDDDRHRDDERRRDDRLDYRDRHDDFKLSEPSWKTEVEKRNTMSPSLKAKRDKAVEEISSKIMEKHGGHISGELRLRVIEELKISISKLMAEMFGYQDVSFIEMVVKFNAKYETRSEIKILKDVMSSLPSHYRNLKRSANEPGASDIPAKSARRSPEHSLNRDIASEAASAMTEKHISEWQANLPPPGVVIPNPMLMSQFDVSQVPVMMMQQPVMVPAPMYTQSFEVSQPQPIPEKTGPHGPNSFFEVNLDEGHHLYLCKDDFEPYSDNQAEYLKKFLISRIVVASSSGDGWTPDFTVKGLQSMLRYELVTRDDATKDWLMNLDFTEFDLFNVLVYTKEELWYERAAIWLPGHSRYRNIEPLTKLKLQNRHLEGINIGKWKFVKKVVTQKGTRIYVDMPPSSARALEKHKMLLSYELQKVNVFLKAVAVDKEAFDSGMREMWVKDPNEIVFEYQNSPMPSLGNENINKTVKICLKGNKILSVLQARKVKEIIIYNIYKYHQDSVIPGKTDFVKFGYCLPGYLGVVPENDESRRWLLSLDLGKLNRHAVVVLGSDEGTKYIRMEVVLNYELSNKKQLVFERIKQSNQGVKGLNFNLWKPIKMGRKREGAHNVPILEVDIDLESVETLLKMRCQLDYVNDKNQQQVAAVKYPRRDMSLAEKVRKMKSESSDSYDVANMDIATSDNEEDDDDDDVIYMGKN